MSSSAGSKPSAPSITFDRHVVGTAGANGWYVSNVQVYWTFAPQPTQTQGCDAVTITAEGATQLDCIAWWDQTRLEDPVTISIDKTAPTVTGHAGRPPDANGWYNSPVSFSFVGTDATSGIASCSSTSYSGPDNGNASVSGTCTDNAGNVGRAAVGFSYDSTPPAVRGVPSRQPDANGWYNRPVSFSFVGTDATSGIAACSSTSYSGPDNGNASVSGTCTDKAGNDGQAAYAFSYDSTPPSVGPVIAKHGNRSVLLSWTVSPGTQVTEVTRSGPAIGAATMVYRGTAQSFGDRGLRPGAKYQYTVTAFDQAANAAAKTLEVTGTGPLIGPAPGDRVTGPVRLQWLPVKGATYYNVQLIRNGRIFSAWPTNTSVKLPRRWTYRGHRYRLRSGTYRWYVWPGFGKLAQARYGRLLGGSSFIYSG